MKDAPTLFGKEEFVSDMVQKLRSRFVVMKDVPIKYPKEEFVEDMELSEQRSRFAVMKVVPTFL